MLKSVVVHDLPMNQVAAMERWYWREIPRPGPAGNLAFTAPPFWPRVATAFFEPQPTEDFCGATIQPHERQVLRWYCLTRYPDGVDECDGERWFLDVRAKELAELGNPYRAFSSRAPRLTPPPWAQGSAYPYLRLGRDFVSSFILERPADEFSRDARGYL